MTRDRNFDDLAHRFKRNVYGGLKGDIRLEVLRRDFAEFVPLAVQDSNPSSDAPCLQQKPWRILDAGGGQGQFALELAKAGHRLVICDISTEMLALAQAQVEELGLQDRVTLVNCAIQDVYKESSAGEATFDLVICHAVLEWVAEPQDLLKKLVALCKPGGYLSLTFYNLHSLIYKNLLRTNFKKIRKQEFQGCRGSLTPTNPLDPDDVYLWLTALPLDIRCRSGIRVFHDYIFNRNDRERDPEGLLEMELQFSRREPYRSLGRYIHVLAKRV